MTVDEGHLWAAEHFTGTSDRTDEFGEPSGGFSLQLTQPPISLEEAIFGVAVGQVGGVAQVYVGGRQSANGEGAVGVFDGGSGAYLSEWTGAGTPEHTFGSGYRTVRDLAVDGSTAAGDWATGDVYVTDPGEGVV